MDDNTVRQINRTLSLYVEAHGIKDTVNNLESLSKALSLMHRVSLKDAEVLKLVKDHLVKLNAPAKDVDNAIIRLGNSVDNTGKKFKQFSQFSRDLEGSFYKARNAANSFADIFNQLGSLAGAAGGIGLASGIKLVNDFNKQILIGAGSWMKYNVGMGAFESGIRKIGSATKLTQQETSQLLAMYEKGFNSPTIKNAETIFKNLKNAVGANKEAMGGMLQMLSGIVSKFPDLEKSVTRLNAADKQRLSLINQQMVLLGQMSLSEAKAFQDYIQGNKQESKADKERKEQIQAQIDAMQDIKKVIEEISFAIGKTLIPHLKTVADFLREAKNTILDFVPAISLAVGGFAALALTIAPIVRMLSLGRDAGKLFGFGRGASGAAGATSAANRSRAILARPGIGGDFWAARGYMAGAVSGEMAFGPAMLRGAGSMAKGVLKGSGGVGILATLASYGLGKVESNQREKADIAREAARRAMDSGDMGSARRFRDDARRYNKNANLSGLGKNLAGIGGYAATGALLGSMLGPIGTTIGTIAGGITGLFMEGRELWKNLGGVAKDWFGLTQASKIHRQEQSDAFKQASEYANSIKKEMAEAAQYAKFGTKEEQIAAVSARTAIETSEKVAANIINIRDIDDKSYADVSSTARGKKLLSMNDEAFSTAMQDNAAAMEVAKKNGDQLGMAMAEATRQVVQATKELNDAKANDTTTNADMEFYANQLRDAKDALEAINLEQSTAYTNAQSRVAANAARQSQIASQRTMGEAYGAEMAASIKTNGNFDAFKQFEENRRALNSVENVRVGIKDVISDDDRGALGRVAGSKANSISGEFIRLGQKEEVENLVSMLELRKKDQEVARDAARDATERKVINSQIQETEQAISAAKAVQNKISEETIIRIGDIDAKNGYILAAMNEQKLVLESQNKLYESQSQLVDSIVQSMAVTGEVNLGSVLDAVKTGVALLEKSNQTIQQTIDIAKAQEQAIRTKAVQDYSKELADVGLDQKAFVTMEIDSSQMATAAEKLAINASQALAAGKTEEAEKYLDASKMVNKSLVSENQRQADITKLEAQRNTLAQRKLDLILKAKEAYAGELELAQALSSKAQAMVDLSNSIGVGLRASVDMHMQAARTISGEIETLERQKAALVEAASQTDDAKEYAKVKAEINKLDTQILGRMKQQADITRTLRDGYISAVTAMTTGSGIFSKIMIDQNKNLGIGVKYLNVLSSKTAGGLFGGKTRAAQFGIEGIDYGDEMAPGYKTWDGRYSNYNPGQDFQQEFKAYLKQMAEMGQSGGNMLGAINAPHMIGAIMQNGIKNAMDTQAGPDTPLVSQENVTGELLSSSETHTEILSNIRDLVQQIVDRPSIPGGTFARGGIVNGPSHASGGVKFAVGGQVHELEGGETVINAKASAKYGGLLSAINESTGGKSFASSQDKNKYSLGGIIKAVASRMLPASSDAYKNMYGVDANVTIDPLKPSKNAVKKSEADKAVENIDKKYRDEMRKLAKEREKQIAEAKKDYEPQVEQALPSLQSIVESTRAISEENVMTKESMEALGGLGGTPENTTSPNAIREIVETVKQSQSHSQEMTGMAKQILGIDGPANAQFSKEYRDKMKDDLQRELIGLNMVKTSLENKWSKNAPENYIHNLTAEEIQDRRTRMQILNSRIKYYEKTIEQLQEYQSIKNQENAENAARSGVSTSTDKINSDYKIPDALQEAVNIINNRSGETSVAPMNLFNRRDLGEALTAKKTNVDNAKKRYRRWNEISPAYMANKQRRSSLYGPNTSEVDDPFFGSNSTDYETFGAKEYLARQPKSRTGNMDYFEITNGDPIKIKALAAKLEAEDKAKQEKLYLQANPVSVNTLMAGAKFDHDLERKAYQIARQNPLWNQTNGGSPERRSLVAQELKRIREEMGMSFDERNVEGTYGAGGIIPRFAAGGRVPDIGSSQDYIKSMLGSRVGDKTLAMFDPDSEIIRGSDISSAKQIGRLTGTTGPASGSQQVSLNLENITLNVDPVDVNALSAMLKRQIDEALKPIAKAISGGKTSTLPKPV